MCYERVRGYRVDVSCRTNETHVARDIQTSRCGRICFFNVLVVKFEGKYRVCECSFVVVRHFVCCERFSSYRADVSCCTNEMGLLSDIQTGRCGRICFFPLLYTVAKVEC